MTETRGIKRCFSDFFNQDTLWQGKEGGSAFPAVFLQQHGAAPLQGTGEKNTWRLECSRQVEQNNQTILEEALFLLPAFSREADDTVCLRNGQFEFLGNVGSRFAALVHTKDFLVSFGILCDERIDAVLVAQLMDRLTGDPDLIAYCLIGSQFFLKGDKLLLAESGHDDVSFLKVD
jgi:hypothetical protein